MQKGKPFKSLVSEATLPNRTRLFCNACQKFSEKISSLKHFVTLPVFLVVEFSSNSIKGMPFSLTMEILDSYFSLKAMVRFSSHYFTVAGSQWIYIDDLCPSVQTFPSLVQLQQNYSTGWFFAIFPKVMDDTSNVQQPTVFYPKPQPKHVSDNVEHLRADSISQKSDKISNQYKLLYTSN